MTCRKGVWKFVTLTGVSLALVRRAFIERLLEELNYWKVSTSDLNSLDIPLWKKRLQRLILDAILGFSDSILSVSYSGYQFKTLFSDMIVGECVQEHSRCIWSIHYASELVYDVFWTSVSILDFAAYILDVRKPLTLFWVCGILRHCEDNAYVYYLTSGYLIWKSV